MLPGLLLLLGLSLPAHPLHSSSASLTDQGGGRVTLAVRIFTDDLVAVAPGGDSAIAAYVRKHVRLTTRGGPVELQILAIVVDGDLTQITARATAVGGLAGLQVQQAVLWERYRDQVNLLRASIGGRRTTMVFANGDPPREV